MLLYKDIRDKLPRHKTKKWVHRSIKGVKYIVVHTTGSINQDPFKTNAYHISPNHISKTGCPRLCYADYIAYHKGFTGSDECIVYRCNNYTEKTWQSGSPMNGMSVGVVIAYNGEEDHLESNKYIIAVEHVARLCIELNVSTDKVIGHREVSWYLSLIGKQSKKVRKSCPGTYFDCDKFRGDVKECANKLIADNDHLRCFYLADNQIVTEHCNCVLF